MGNRREGGFKENQGGDQRNSSAQEEEKEDGAVSAFLSLAAITHGRASSKHLCILITGCSS